ncbi:transcription termination/antitermination NusG family protein [Nioella sp.]|uniref:transcription termination/antitermination NusG family protein n=1 Tax=Nioella sp. TaxID=1912091 RepID=UPI0035111AFB
MSHAKAFDSEGLQVGDYVLDEGRAPITIPGTAGWYALRVAPQREGFVERWLGLRGVTGFHPVLRRRVVRFGKPRESVTRYLPGYVFARFPGEPIPHAVQALPHILGALTARDGHWARLVPSDLRALYGMRNTDADLEDTRATEQARRKRAAALRVGQGALFRSGPMAGVSCEVVELKGTGDVRVRLRAFGSDRVVTAQDRDLVALRKTG